MSRIKWAVVWWAFWAPGAPTVGLGASPTADSRVGMLVVTKAPRISLKAGDRDAGTTEPQVIYRVTRVNGPWFWVEAGKISGWIRGDDVVPLDQANDYFSEEIRKHPKTAWLYQMRGLVWYEKKEYDRAISDYIEAAALDPKDSTSYHNLGNAWLAKREYDTAITDFNEATKLDAKDVASVYHRAMAWMAKKDYALAIADLNEAIRLDPSDASKFRNRALAWAATGEYGPALDDFDRAIRLDPKDALAYNGRAWILATCPDPKYRSGKKAVASATRACELVGWQHPYLLGTLAAAYAESGDFANAVKWQSKALELFPKDEPDQEGHRRRLALYEAKKSYREERSGTAR